jgi:hypothetical protein
MKLFKKQNPIVLKNENQNEGFVILFAVVLTSIILSVSLGLADITYKEISFGTSAKNTGDAFFASDTGIECALYYDFKWVQTPFGDYENPFGYNGGDDLTLQCAGTAFDFTDGYSTVGPWEFILHNLGPSGKACSIVKVTKTPISGTPNQIQTKIISKGYNLGGDNTDCISTSPNKVEREIELTYYEDDV